MLRRLNFNLWYFFHPPWNSGVSPPELFDFISKHPPGRAIDLGCGSGTNVVTLAQHGWNVTGVGFAPRAIQLAAHKAVTAGLEVNLLVGDVTKLDGIAGHFDLALDLGCFHGVSARAGYLSCLQRLLIPGGYWLIYGFFKSNPAARGPGLDASAINEIRDFGWVQRSRADGMDKRGRPSAWFLYQRPPGDAFN